MAPQRLLRYCCITSTIKHTHLPSSEGCCTQEISQPHVRALSHFIHDLRHDARRPYNRTIRVDLQETTKSERGDGCKDLACLRVFLCLVACAVRKLDMLGLHSRPSPQRSCTFRCVASNTYDLHVREGDSYISRRSAHLLLYPRSTTNRPTKQNINRQTTRSAVSQKRKCFSSPQLSRSCSTHT